MLADSGESFQAEDGETVLAAARRAGCPFPCSCQAGNCGTCKCELVDGEIFELDYSEYALSPAERARGLVLACRSQVWGDTTIRRLGDDEVAMHPARQLDCRVVSIHASTHDVRTIRLAIEAGGPFNFSAGQYATLEVAPGFARHFSMANRPDEPLLEFQIRRMPQGRVSGYLFERLACGDPVKVSGPEGISFLREQHTGPILMLAGGTGLAPLQSILRSLLARGCRAPITLFFGVRAERDIYNEALLASLARAHANFRYEIVLSESNDGARRRGFVHAAAADAIASVAGMKAYLAGPPVMVEAAIDMLKEKGMPNRDIHADAYHDQP